MSSPSVISVTPSVHPLFQSILDNPSDHYLKLVFADYLEEEGKTAESLAWRWIGKNGKYPEYWGVKYCWWSMMPPDHSLVGREIMSKLMIREYKLQEESYFNLVWVLVENPQFMEKGTE